MGNMRPQLFCSLADEICCDLADVHGVVCSHVVSFMVLHPNRAMFELIHKQGAVKKTGKPLLVFANVA
ncbi:hypothetical protein Z950_1771 [Sulfitobacter mediterraneus KCTC 32188]|nr:hypothetical protein Z950_1771 [Sulfitobacter mediterraneus KCTC 32188]